MKIENTAKTHSAGATVIHTNPFKDLEVYRNESAIEQAFLNKWVIPFYLPLLSLSDSDRDSLITNMANSYQEISPEIIQTLLGDFNWRTRIVGAFFAALTDAKDFEDLLGKHLLKSEVCYAGREYCATLAIFNTPASIDYLHQYLYYYLGRPDLNFDQVAALIALRYLDKVNNTNELSKHTAKIVQFYKGEFEIDELDTEQIEDRLYFIEEIKKKSGQL